MRVTILDYGAGNLHSLAKAVATAPVQVAIESDPARALATDVLILPGVGAFGAAAARIAAAREDLRGAIGGGLPTLGICLGMQLLFDRSEESDGAGLGLIAGEVTRLDADRTPQIGWNTIDGDAGSGFSTAYYANRYACRPRDASVVRAWSTHERDRFPAIVRQGAVLGVQFHPEKSSAAGVAFIQRFLAEAAR